MEDRLDQDGYICRSRSMNLTSIISQHLLLYSESPETKLLKGLTLKSFFLYGNIGTRAASKVDYERIIVEGSSGLSSDINFGMKSSYAASVNKF